jgi:transcriptional regulator with XRE-family HTH domain
MSAPAGLNPALAAVLRRLRHQSGLTQEALAFRSGVTIATLSRIERDLVDPAWSKIRAVATALGMSLEELGAAIEQEQAHHTKDDTEGGSAQ